MQKITEKLKNTPRNVQSLLVPCSVSSSLNREETLSVRSKVRSVINPEGVQPECAHGLKAVFVYVLSKNRKSLMPCKPTKARRLLKARRAVFVKRFPFTIQLNFECENKVQEVSLGVDSGYKNIGFSVVSETKELISGTVKLDGKTSKRLSEKRMQRKNRRNRLWHRKPRFDNRAKPEEWIPPSIERRYQIHLNIINRLKKTLPISKVTIEVANFDIQKIINPDVQGKEYQQGRLYGYQNMKSYLMTRERGKCQLCGKDFKGQPSHIHHCKQRSEAGSNRAGNLAILHKTCHEKLHKMRLKLPQPKSYKPNTFMSIIHKRFYTDIYDVEITYEYRTFVKQNELGLEKSHSTDAFVIAGGTLQKRIKTWDVEQRRRHNRAIQLNRKGFKPSIRTSVYKIQPKDLIRVAGIFSVIGIQNRGSYVKVKNHQKVIPTKTVDSIYNFAGLSWN